MNWAQLIRNPRGTGRVYTRAEIRKLEQAAYPTTNDGERKLVDQNEAVHAENRRLVKEVADLSSALGDARAYGEAAHQGGVVDGLNRAWNLVHDWQGRPGKNQIMARLKDEIEKEAGN